MFDRGQSRSAVALLLGLLVVALFLRLNAATFAPAAEAMRFAFQLALAGTVIAVLRNEIGLSTFGVFGPVILAFALLDIGVFWGFLVIAYVFLVAVAARTALTGLDLGTPHRVAALLAVVTIAVFVVQALGQLQGVPPFTAVLLFPVILTAWYAERFVGGVVDTGWAPACRRLASTVIGVAAATAVAGYDVLVSAVVATPETWAVLVAINVLLGSFTDVRLAEYVRFRSLKQALAGDAESEVLTMRVRNREFVSRYNPGSVMSWLDKVRMKQTLHGLDIPTPETHLVVEDKAGLDDLAALLAEHDRFAVKPVDGSGGRDVLVVRGRNGDGTLRTNRGTMTDDEVVAFARDICVGGVADYGARSSALVEGLVTPDGLLADRVHGGVPDLRVITLQGFPVMAMVRLPTAESNDTANIHAGAVAVAVDIETGVASGGYQQSRDRYLDSHPDTGASLSFSIPAWEDVLQTASRASISSGLGYVGVDVVFDETHGPQVLEVNRRPGLGIQNANVAGLLRRLRHVEANATDGQFASATERVRQSITWAAADWRDVTGEPPREKAIAADGGVER